MTTETVRAFLARTPSQLREADARESPTASDPAVLVVEDDTAVSDLIRTILVEEGIPTVTANTGERAVRIARERPIGLVILDVHLPGISGYETCRVLRQAFGRLLPIIFVSGERTEPFDRVGGLLLGADDYITKPFANDEVLARTRRLLTHPPMPRSAGDSTLTKRESEILTLLAQGMHQTAISSHLTISSKTVSTHIDHILRKLGAQSRAQAVAIAYRDGLVAPTTVPSLSFVNEGR